MQAWQLPATRVTSDDGGTLTVAAPPGGPTARSRDAHPADRRTPLCSGDQLDVRLLGSDAAVGHRGLYVAARNTSDAPCLVDGYPTYGFTTLDGARLDVTASHGTAYMASDPGSRPVVVPPGGVVRAAVTWDALSTGDDPPATTRRRPSDGVGAGEHAVLTRSQAERRVATAPASSRSRSAVVSQSMHLSVTDCP
ncbi:DUF4232 domain-containing protein [Luteimicrobium subarcticum]|uniref:DUF4232 domain-containing protein n=1 Tax=Luteimicrobium subarcticum TaxID=620910 RepID=UPI0012FD0ACA|nr:DUF4232 domain-containing protein [Luteimicrobium subarcticum]